MKNIIRFFPLVILCAYIVFKVRASDDVAPPVYTPTAAQQVQLQEVQATLEDYPTASEELSKMFEGLAIVIQADSRVLKTTSDVRATHQNAGSLAVQVGQVPRIPGYSAAVDKFLNANIGVENVPVDAAKRAQIVEAFKALGWATKK